MMTAAYALVADIGGTRNRWQLLKCSRGALTPLATCIQHNDDFPSFAAALTAAYTALGQPPLSQIVIAAAGPVANQRIVLTNRPDWVIDAAVLSQTYRAAVTLVNDFAAQAWGLLTVSAAECEALTAAADGLPNLPSSSATESCSPLRPHARPLAVIGPGTGLGIAFLWQRPQQPPLVLSSEAGNLRLPPLPALAEYWTTLTQEVPTGQPYWEWLLSGPGLVRLYRLRTNTSLRGKEAEAIVAAAHAADPAAAATVATFAELLAAFAAEAVLMTWATAGVVLVGSLVQAIAPWLRTSAWHTAFVHAPRYAQELAATPRWLIHASDLGLRGAAWLACQQALPTTSSLDQRTNMRPG